MNTQLHNNTSETGSVTQASSASGTNIILLLLFTIFSGWLSGSALADDTLRNWNLVIDNDFLSGSGDDRGYTGGLRVTTWVDQEVSWQGGLLIFTPENLETDLPITNDQPYANLVYLARSKQWFSQSEKVLYKRTLSIGLLGTQIAESVQSALHNYSDSPRPRGYHNQISDGGELTARVGFSRYTPLALIDNQQGQLSVLLETTVSGGYITDASIGVGFRLSTENFAWAEASNDFLPHLDAADRSTRARRAVFGGVRIRGRAYNVFLQGQFRDSAVTYAKDELNLVIGEAWLGVSYQFANIQTTYALRYQTSEIRGQGRTKLWGSLNLTVRFN